jgi:hypothetical protein
MEVVAMEVTSFEELWKMGCRNPIGGIEEVEDAIKNYGAAVVERGERYYLVVRKSDTPNKLTLKPLNDGERIVDRAIEYKERFGIESGAVGYDGHSFYLSTSYGVDHIRVYSNGRKSELKVASGHISST